MFLTDLNAEIVTCTLLFRKLRHKPNLESTSKYGFSPDLGGKMRMQVILDSPFARPGTVPIRGGKKGEFRDRTSIRMIAWPHLLLEHESEASQKGHSTIENIWNWEVRHDLKTFFKQFWLIQHFFLVDLNISLSADVMDQKC